MTNIINLEKNILENAKISACKINDKETRIRAYALNIAANATAYYFDKIGLASDTGLSLYKIPSFQENFELADVYVKGFRFDVRISFDGKNFTIPKIHEKFGATPLAYVVISLNENLDIAEFLGFVPTEGLKYPESNSEYYNMNVSVLKPIDEIKELIENSTLNIHPYSANNHEKIKELSASFIDGEIADSEKIFFIKHIVACPVCRETFCDISDFNTIVAQIKNYQELLNDSTLSVLSGNKREVEEAVFANLGLLENAEENQLISVNSDEESLDFDEQSNDEQETDEDLNEASEESLDLSEEESDLDLESSIDNEEETFDGVSLDELDSMATLATELDSFAEGEEEQENVIADESLELTPVENIESTNVVNEVLNDSLDISLDENNIDDEFSKLNTEENIIEEQPLQFEVEEMEILEEIQEPAVDINIADKTDEDVISFSDEPVELMEVEETIVNKEDKTFDLNLAQDEEEILENIEDDILESEPDDVIDFGQDDIVLEEVQDSELIEDVSDKHIDIVDISEEIVAQINTDDELIKEDENTLLESDFVQLDETPLEDIQEIGVEEDISITDNSESAEPEVEEQPKEEQPNVETEVIGVYQNSYIPPQPVELKYDEEELGVVQEELEHKENVSTVNEEEMNSEIQNLLDDDLMALLSDDDSPNSEMEQQNTDSSMTIVQEDVGEDVEPMQSVDNSTNVENQVTDNENINNLFETDENANVENVSTFELAQEPIRDEVVKKTKNFAIVAGLLIVLLGAGSSMLVLNKQKAMNNDDVQQGNEMFDFASNSENKATQAPAISQDINRSMTNSFSDKPAAITITKLSWQISEKLAIEPSVKEYLQTAGKNIQMNLQNDLSNSADIAFNNMVKVSFTIAPDNTLKGLQILESSGSDEIDANISTSIKNTLKYVSVPKLKDYQSDYFLTLIINF